MLEWKRERNGSTALLLKGARRVGKSTVAKAFAENEYKSYILIDFVQASKEVKQLFDNLMDLNYIFLRLQSIYQVILETQGYSSHLLFGIKTTQRTPFTKSC